MEQLALFDLPAKYIHALQPADHAELHRRLLATLPGGAFTESFPGRWTATNARLLVWRKETA